MQGNKSHLFICNAEERKNNPQRPTSKCKNCLMMWEKSQLSPSSSVCILEENNPQFILQGSEAVSSERRRRLIKVMVEGDPSILFASSSSLPLQTLDLILRRNRTHFSGLGDKTSSLKMSLPLQPGGRRTRLLPVKIKLLK